MLFQHTSFQVGESKRDDRMPSGTCSKVSNFSFCSVVGRDDNRNHNCVLALSLISDINLDNVDAPSKRTLFWISQAVAKSNIKLGLSLLIQARVYNNRLRRNDQGGSPNSQYP